MILALGACKENKFSGYLYPVKENGLYGYIDSVGNRIMEPKFLWASVFSNNGLAMVVVDTIYRESTDSMAFETGASNQLSKTFRMYAKYGYIDKSGNFAIPPKFLCYVKMPEKGFVGSDMDKCSNVFYKFHFRNERALFYDTLSWKNGYIDSDGSIVVKPKYCYASRFSQGKAIVYKKTGKPLYVKGICLTPYKIRCAYIDKDGKPSTDFIYESLTDFCANRGIGVIHEMSGDSLDSFTILNVLINEKGVPVDTFETFNSYYAYSEDGICLAKQQMFLQVYDGMTAAWTYYDKNGHALEPLKGLSEAQMDILSKRKDIMQVFPKDVDIIDATYFSDGLAGVTTDYEHWFVIDKYMIIHGYGEQSIYQAFKGFGNGLAAVKKNGKWGFINNKLIEVIPCKYDSCSFAYPYLEEVFSYDSNGEVSKKMLINRKDSLVWECKIQDPKTIKNIYSGKEKKNWGRWIFVDDSDNFSFSDKILIFSFISLCVICFLIVVFIRKKRKG